MGFLGWSLFSLVPWLLSSRRKVTKDLIWLSSIQLLTILPCDAFDCDLFGDVWTKDAIASVDESMALSSLTFPALKK